MTDDALGKLAELQAISTESRRAWIQALDREAKASVEFQVAQQQAKAKSITALDDQYNLDDMKTRASRGEEFSA